MLPVVEKSFFIFHLQLTQEEKKNSEAYEEEEEKEEEKEYGNGKFTRYLIMNVTGGRVELRKLLFVLTFLTLAAFGNWIALAYIHDFVGRFVYKLT